MSRDSEQSVPSVSPRPPPATGDAAAAAPARRDATVPSAALSTLSVDAGGGRLRSMLLAALGGLVLMLNMVCAAACVLRPDLKEKAKVRLGYRSTTPMVGRFALRSPRSPRIKASWDDRMD